PVDKYIGGAEHACMHLLYSRFIAKALRDMGYINFGEPFTSLVHQGLILGADGEKMSKSKGNVVNPDSYINEYGSDIFRMYLMFGFAFAEGGAWNDDGIKAIYRFAERVERIVSVGATAGNADTYGSAEKELDYALNYAIKHVTADLENLSFNTALARIMELVNALNKYAEKNVPGAFFRKACMGLVKLIAPFAPHIAEELNELMGEKGTVFCDFPSVDESKLVKDEIEYGVQVNSKMKTKMVLSTSLDNAQITEIIKSDDKIKEILDGKEIKKIIVIPKRLINIIV
ncbi:MAG: class I tRNA ligase family protein, partial [Clostridia bacterium]|nr:class I tRNA ligase family protein [Clostridia bacterium]